MAFKGHNEGPIVDDSPEMDEFGSAQGALDRLESGSFGFDTEEEESEAVDTTVETSDVDDIQDEFDQAVSEGDAEAIAQEIAEIEIKAAKGLHKFKLDPNDEELIKTLQLGVGARPAFSKAAQLEKEIKALKESMPAEDIKSKAQMVDDFQELVSKGFREQAVKALLGEDYDVYRRESIISHVDYENATPEERFEMDKARMQRERELSEYQKERELERKTRELEQMRQEALEDKWLGIGTKLLSKYSMDSYIDDPVLAEEYNEELWTSAWNTMEALYPDHKDWSPVELEKVFRRKAKLFRGGMEKQVEGRLERATEAKKAKAKTDAKMVARQNYTANKDDVGNKLKTARSALDRLNLLSRL